MTVEKRTMEIGFHLPSISKEIVFGKMYLYSGRFGGWFLKSVHTDRTRAKEAGFPDAVCQGTMILNYMSEMLFNV